MKKLFLALSLLPVLGLVGCDVELNGTANVAQPFNMVDKKGKTFTIPAGQRSIEMEIDQNGSGKKSEVKIKIDDASGKERKVEMKVPAGVIPERTGSFRIVGSSVGQPVDIAGNVVTQESDSPRVRTTQTCTYYVREYRCERVAVRDRDGRIHYERRCGYVDVPVSGQQEIEYHTHYIQVNGNGQFITPDNMAVANWSGAYSASQRVTDYESACYHRAGYPYPQDNRYPRDNRYPQDNRYPRGY
jgi:hypothetical protein